MTKREPLLTALRRGMTLLADFAYGIDAGNAIRHGLPVPRRHGDAGRPVLPEPRSRPSSVADQRPEDRPQITPKRRGASTVCRATTGGDHRIDQIAGSR